MDKPSKKKFPFFFKGQYYCKIYELFYLSSYLNPKYKKLIQMETVKHQIALKYLKFLNENITQKSQNKNEQTALETSECRKKIKTTNNYLDYLLEELNLQDNLEVSYQNDINREVFLYESKTTNLDFEDTNNTLQFWYLNKNQFPILSSIVISLFSIQPTSIECERILKKASNIRNKKRNILKGQTFSQLIFLKSNLERKILDKQEIRQIIERKQIQIL